MDRALLYILVPVLVSNLPNRGLAHGGIPIGFCSLSCNQHPREDHQEVELENVGDAGNAGLIGPAGPPGERGPPGMPGSSCDCSRTDELEARIRDLETALKKLIDEEENGTLDGWYLAKNGLSYKLFKEKVSYDTAKSRCVSLHARLASTGMQTDPIRSEVIDNVVKPNKIYTWLGLDDLESANTWLWSDGVLGNSRNIDWRPGDPDSALQHCGLLYDDWKVIDAPCENLYYYLCEYAA